MVLNQGTLAVVRDIFCFKTWDGGAVLWVEVKDAVSHPTMHRTAPTTEITWPQTSALSVAGMLGI